MVDSAELSRLRIARPPESSSPVRFRKRTVFAAVGLVAVALAVGTVYVATRDGALEVRTASVALRGGSAGGGLTANGYVVARTKASVSSKVPGRLASLAYEEGDRVAAGAVIAQLDAAEYEAAIRQATAELGAVEAVGHEAEAAVAQARRSLARAQMLARDSLVSSQLLEDATTAVEVAEIRQRAAAARLAAARQSVAMAEANLENTRVRAPFAGTVLRKDAEVGEVVAPSVGGGLTRGAVVTMADLSTLEVEVDVNESYIGGIREGQRAEIILDAYPGERFPGSVRQVVPTADRQKATVLVRVAIGSQDPRILPEMGARVEFASPTAPEGATPTAPRVFAPAGAVRTEGGETVVYVVANGRAVRRVVDAGPVSADEREIRQGLNGGETVVLEPPTELTDGAQVRAAESNANGEAP